ncbi:uncharacterized protein TNCV_4627581 [Trichonephila clavipes]|nr:uncharacterized protein TNCV_4627581 [Trichonephila clavipes]
MSHSSGIVVSDAMSLGLSSNPRESMDVCKCIEPSRHGSTLKSRRATSPLGRLVELEERGEHPYLLQGVLPQIGVEKSQIVLSPVLCSKLWLTPGVTYPFAMMNFRGLNLAFAYEVATTPEVRSQIRIT